MTELRPGDEAPAFEARAQDGTVWRLADLQGKHVVLFFYPRDDTPGCTKEACAFRDNIDRISDAGALVLGVSRDDAASHRKFAEKYDLNFPLLVDAGPMSEAYGTWVEKRMYGRTFMGIQRATFLIGADGNLQAVWPKVKVDGHVDEVLEALGAGP